MNYYLCCITQGTQAITTLFFYYFNKCLWSSIQYHSNPSLCPTSNAKEAEAEWFYEDLQDVLELIPKKDVLYIIGDWNPKVGSQEIPGVTGKFGLGVQNEAGQRLTEFCQENALVIPNTLPIRQEETLFMDITRWSIPKIQIDYNNTD